MGTGDLIFVYSLSNFCWFLRSNSWYFTGLMSVDAILSPLGALDPNLPMDSLRSIFVTLLLFLLIFQGVFVGRADSLAFEQDGLSNVFLQMKINTTDDAKNILSSAIIAIFGYLDTIQDAELEKTCIKFNETVSPMPTIQEAESFKEKVVRLLIWSSLAALFLFIAGLASALQKRWMSLSICEIRFFQETGTLPESRANSIIQILERCYQMVSSLVLVGGAAMEAFLLCMEKVTDLWFWLDFILSITVVVLVEEVIPNAIYKRYGVAMALRCFYLVHILMMITYPISYSFTKLLDLIVGKESATLYTRNELKAVTSVNGIQAGNGGDLLQDEIAEIHGILDSIEKTAETIMKRITSTVPLLDAYGTLNWNMIYGCIAQGCNNMLVYEVDQNNIVGYIDVKRLLAAFYFLLQDEEAAFKTGLHILNIKRLLTEIPRVKQNDSVRDCLEHLTQEKALFALVMETLPDGGRPIGVISLVDVVKAIFMVDVGRDEKKLWVLEEPKLLSK